MGITEGRVSSCTPRRSGVFARNSSDYTETTPQRTHKSRQPSRTQEGNMPYDPNMRILVVDDFSTMRRIGAQHPAPA